ncbi:hypothetical protein B0T24DRAFT_652198 [Lasiosphaeria ovina]|uniref:DUF6589 domain-containing protein n=1 Tax=Lasiosphaeria ovina TaxID=92902 RepID=A0AAE0JUZ5_9PEZI|nr:hypothetical protein B0T24DRAFT_652198 [Lasiosphaeria ovina]
MSPIPIERAKENIKKVARDPNSIIVYDNFNFISRIRELVGGKKDEIINLITAYIISYLELGGAIQKANFRPRTKITKRMIIDYILPRRETVNNTSNGGRSSNYGPEILYFAWLLHPRISEEHTIRAILKGSLIRYTIAGSGYKAIDLILKYINASYTLDIKYNKNSIYDIYTTFSRLALNGNFLTTIRKSVKTLFESKQKGTHKAGDPIVDIISYAYKLYNDSITKRNNKEDRPKAFNTPNIFKRGQQILLEKLDNFNKAIIKPKDLTEQRLIPGTILSGTKDGEIN